MKTAAKEANIITHIKTSWVLGSNVLHFIYVLTISTLQLNIMVTLRMNIDNRPSFDGVCVIEHFLQYGQSIFY